MEAWPINPVDIAVAAVLLLSAIFAFARGLVHEVLSVVAWIGAAAATILGFPHLRPYAQDLISVPLLADIATGVAIFLFTLVLLTLITRSIAKRVQESALGPLDRSLGFVFGLLRGAFLICLLWVPVAWYLPRSDFPTWLTEAKSLPLIEQGAAILIDLVPPELKPRGEVPDSPLSPGGGLLQQVPEIIDGVGESLESIQGQAGRGDESGYNADQRQDLERLIDATDSN